MIGNVRVINLQVFKLHDDLLKIMYFYKKAYQSDFSCTCTPVIQ